MDEADTVEFRVLGPLEVVVDGRSVPLGAAKQRLVLAALLAGGNTVVSIDRLVDIVWGEFPPGSAERALQTYIYRLRGAIEPGRVPGDPAATLLTRPPGYLLELRPGQLDATRFTDLISQAKRRAAGDELAGAAALLDEALGLWHGPAWAEFAEFDFARAEVTRLEGHRAGATEDRADIELALGHHTEVIGELEATVARYPLRERSRGQLMLALYRSGRQAEALRVYHAFRSYLIDEIGLEPSADLQRLEDDILLNKPDLNWTGTPDGASGLVSIGRPAPPTSVASSPTGPLPAGTVTFCFTDIEGSTRLLRRLGQRYGEVLERHRNLMRRAVADHGGVEIRADGDGMFFAFGSAASAIAACSAGQRALSDERWPDGISVLVRMGLHTGEAAPNDGDYVALAVHQAARVAGAAHGGQILVSDATAATVGEALDLSTTMRDLGAHHLRDFERPTKLFQLCHPGLPAVFPPPRATGGLVPGPSSTGTHRDLPARLEQSDVQLLGRAQDLEWLAVLWQRALVGERPIAMVSGAVGSGKTALVAAFARQVHALGAVVTYASGKDLANTRRSLPEALCAALRQNGVEESHRSGQSNDQPSEATPEEIERRVVLLAAEAPLLVALDDVDCSEAASLAELVQVRSAGRGLLVLATVCESDGDDHSHRDASGVPPSSVHRRHLHGLSPEYVGLVLAHGGEPRSRELVEAVHAETGGNPALVLDAGRRLRDQDAAARVERALVRAEAARQDLSAAEEMAGSNILERGQLSNCRRPLVSAESGPVTSDVCPYKGLARFDVADAGYFCGRERLVATLVARLAVARFVGVVGASGSGKSSLLRAGLLAALGTGALPGSETWPTVVCTPGANPLESLASALAPVARRSSSELRCLLKDNPEEFESIAHAALDTDPQARLVIVLDQFEELVTACRDGDARQRLVDVVINATAEADSRMVVVAVLRADYYGALAAYPELARLLEKSQVLVGAMTEAELRRAIIEPARRAGLMVEAELVEAVSTDARGEPGALPLVSTALLETWVRRQNQTLTQAGYLDAGGVRGALARMAEEVFDSFDARRQSIARRVFLRLAEPGEGHEDLRRRVPRSELALGAETDSVVDTLIERRLLAADGETVEVAHEALLREWPRLRAWLEEDRQGRHLHRQLTEGAVAWEAEGRDPSALYRGVRLAAASDWASAHHDDANALEREFLDRSVAAQDSELRSTRHRARRLRSLAGGLAIVLVVALVAGGLALVQRSNAIHQATAADASRLASQADALADKNPDLSLLLAVEARRQQPSVATDGALEAALARTTSGLDRIVHLTPAALYPAMSNDGRLIAAPGQDGVVRLVAVGSGRVVQTLPGDLGSRFGAMGWSRDGARVVGGGSNGNVIVWNLRTGAREATIHVGGGIALGAFGDGPGRIVTASGDGSVSEWDLSDPTQPRRVGDPIRVPPFSGSTGVPIMFISPDGTRVAIGEFAQGGGQAFVFDLGSHALLRQLPGTAAGWSTDGASLATTLGDRIVVWDLATGQPRGAPLTGFVDASPGVSFNADDSLLAAGDIDDNSVRIFDLASGRQVRAAIAKGHTVHFLADGRLAVGSDTSTSGTTTQIRLYRVGGPSIPPIATALGTQAGVQSTTTAPANNNSVTYTMAKFALHGTEVITQEGPGAPLLAWRASTGRRLGPVLGGAVQSQHGIYLSPNGLFLAVSHADGRLEVWDLATRQLRGVVSTGNTAPSVSWMPSGRELVTSNPGGKLAFWSVSESGRVTPRARTTVDGFAPDTPTDPIVSPDGQIVSLIPYDGGTTISLLDASSGRKLRGLPVDAGFYGGVAFSPDSKTLAVFFEPTGQTDGQLVIRDVATGALRATLSLPYFPAYHGLAFVRGGAWLLTTEGAGGLGSPLASTRMDLWDADTLEPIGDTLSVPSNAAYLSPNRSGDKVGTGADEDNGLPLVWNMNPASWEATACQIAGRNLSHAEWNEYLAGHPYRMTCPQWPAGA